MPELTDRMTLGGVELPNRLVPYEEWVKRIHTFVDEPPTLND